MAKADAYIGIDNYYKQNKMKTTIISSLGDRQSVEVFFTKNHKLIGLNKPWRVGGFDGYYATVQTGKDDSGWFHSGFDEGCLSLDRQAALFNMFKNSEDMFFGNSNHQVKVKCDGYADDGTPIHPIITELILNNI